MRDFAPDKLKETLLQAVLMGGGGMRGYKKLGCCSLKHQLSSIASTEPHLTIMPPKIDSITISPVGTLVLKYHILY